ncbi:hypothetical protein KR009_003265 [Drosophila setifemur]|nr:hypothetical protein KR009_003265 [Drosophila setifemur]
MENIPLAQVSLQLLDFFAGLQEQTEEELGAVAPLRLRRCGDIIRYHSEDLARIGDLSVASSARYWESFCGKQGRKLHRLTELLLPDEEQRQELIEHSSKWLFPIKEIYQAFPERYSIKFQRQPIIKYVLNSILSQGQDYGRPRASDKRRTVCLTLRLKAGAGDGALVLRHYRLQQLYEVVRRLVDYSLWRLVEEKDAVVDTLLVNVESQRCSLELRKDHVCLVSGPVLESVKKTATDLDLASYLELRSTHMRLMALHRSGIRPAGCCNLDALMLRLGEAAVKVDLFEVRHASAARVVRNGLGSSKGASYILYNSARLETLLRTFEQQVKAGIYDPLPPLAEIDLGVLEEDVSGRTFFLLYYSLNLIFSSQLDWQLIYGCLLPFPELLESMLDQLEQGQVGVHLLVRYVDNLASVFSRYYRHKKVLVQRRDQLTPILYARIYLIKAVRQVMNLALSLLGIQPVDYV